MTPAHPKRYVIDEKEIVGKHFARLTRLLQEEDREDRRRFKSEILDKKPEERERGGKALLRLVLAESHYNPSGQRLLSFSRADNRFLPRYGIQVGDVVSLSGLETPAAGCVSGTVYDKDRKMITVAFTRKLPGWVGHEQIYHLNLAENLTTTERMFEALREVGRARHTSVAYLRDISLGLKKARFKDPVLPQAVSFFDPKLNDLQKKAVCKALEAEDVLLVHGPPGTGKSRVLVEIIRQARKNRESVLVSAPSNAACDHLVEMLVETDVPVTRLGHPARMTNKIREHTLSYKIAGHPYAKMIDAHESRLDQLARQSERRQERRVMSWDEKRAMRDEVHSLRDDIRLLKAEIFQQVWNASDVVVATHTVCGDPILKSRTFDWVVLDEATQGIEPATWIAIARGGKLVLAGDHCQLPPTVFSPRTGPDSLRFTLFERFHQVLGEDSKIRLETQYRMHEAIMAFPSRKFYGGKLVADGAVSGRVLGDLPGVNEENLPRVPATFLDTAGLGYEEKTEPGSESRFNEGEAGLVVKYYRRFLAAGLKPEDIAVISPYSAQVKWIANLLQEKDSAGVIENAGPEIDSVDAFQGREKEVVIVSLVRSNLTGQLGFLEDIRRMNVAMTRAKRKLIVIGDSATLSNISFYEEWIRYVEAAGGYLSAWGEVEH